MQCTQSDSRSGRVLFACHCLLNANAKVCGLAGYAGAHRPLLDMLADNGIGVIQLPCPEFQHMGPKRWWQTRAQYDVPAYRALCDRFADDAAELASTYARAGYEVLGILGVNGSPSCGVTEVYDSPEWGGRPGEVDLAGCRIEGSGIFVQSLRRAFEERSLHVPHIGVASSDTDLSGILHTLLPDKTD